MFSSNAIWGIDIGESCIKAVLLKKTDGIPHVMDFDYVELDPEIRANSGERASLSVALNDLFGRIPMDRAEVNISISGRSVNSRFISLPDGLKDSEFKKAILEEAERQIPFPLAEVQWGYVRQPDRDEQVQVAIFAVKKETIAEVIRMIPQNKAKVRGIQVPGLALYNYLHYMEDMQEHVVVLDFGEKTTDLLVIHDGGCWLRSMPLSGQHITDLLEKKFRITTKEANTLKHEMESSPQRDKLFRVIEPKLKELVTEIKRSLNFRRTQVKSLKPTKFLAYGGSSQLSGVADYFNKELGLQALELDPEKNLDFTQCDNAEKILNNLASYGVAIGLALQGLGEAEVNLNLVPKEHVAKQMIRERRYLAVVLNAILLAVTVLYYSSGNAVIDKLENATKAVSQQTQQVNNKQGKYNALKSGIPPLLSDGEFLLSLTGGENIVPEIYQKVMDALAISDKVFLTEFTLAPLSPASVLGREEAEPEGAQPAIRGRPAARGRGAVAPAASATSKDTPTLVLSYVGEDVKSNQVFHEALMAIVNEQGEKLFKNAQPLTDNEERWWKYSSKVSLDDWFELNRGMVGGNIIDDAVKMRNEKGWNFSDEKEKKKTFAVNAQQLTLPVNIKFFYPVAANKEGK